MRLERWLEVVSLALVVGLGKSVAAEDPPGKPVTPASGPASFVTRLLEVGDVTTGTTDFLPDRVAELIRPDQADDQENPIFGGESEEVLRPYGGPADLMELIRTAVGPPDEWSREGVSLSMAGDQRILVRAPATMVGSIQRFLADLVQRTRSTVTIDVVALAGDPSAAADGDIATTIARGTLVPLAGARACGAIGQRIVGRQGGQAAYLRDFDVAVAEKAQGGDPVVGVVCDGLVFDARASIATSERIFVDLHASWSRRLPSRAAESKETGAVELVEIDARTGSALMDLKPGAWTVLSSSGAGGDGVVLAVRATSRPYDVEPKAAATLGPATPLPPLGTLVVRSRSTLDLWTKIGHRRGRSIDLWPSKYTAPEPPEIPEPKESIASEQFLELVRQVVDPESWNAEGTSIDFKAGTLYTRTDEARQGAIVELIAELRAACVRATKVRAVVVSVPLSSLPEYWTGLDDATLVADGGAALVARAGAKVIDRAALRLAPGQRDAAVNGHQRNYVADYNVEIAQSAFIGNPVVREAFEGISFDVDGTSTGNGAGLVAEIRLDRSTLRATKMAPTAFGEIECPNHGVLRMHGSTVIPLGATRLISANLDGRDATLVLVSAAGD